MNKWYLTVLDYLNREATYSVVLTMLKAFGVKISDALSTAITNLGLAIGALGTAIVDLVEVIKAENKKDEAQ